MQRQPINHRRRSRHDRALRVVGGTVTLGLAGVIIAAGLVATDTFGAGGLYDRAVARIDRILAGPVPERSAPATVLIADPADETDAPDATPTSSAGILPGGSGRSATPAPTAARVAVDVDIVSDPKAVFAHEIKDTWCASAGVQMTLAVLGKGNISNAFQRELQGRVHEWESYADSHNGDWGPSAMALALEAYGVKGYEVRAYTTRTGALRDAARAIEKTHSPVLLLAWKGAHTWVMTGFRADADPAVFSNAKIAGTYILDPWYPTVSTIWGPSDPPGTFQDTAEMIRNYLPWKRPEGTYGARDGRFIAVVPTIVAGSGS